MFTLEASPYGKKDSGGFTRLLYNGEVVCQMEEWILRCCGVNALGSFNCNYKWWTKKHIDELIAWFASRVDGTHLHTNWMPMEFMFSLSDDQVTDFKALVSHPKVKLIDRFMNKAHGPYHINIYRLSVTGDFNAT